MYTAENIRVSAGNKSILDGASLTLAPGKVVAVVARTAPGNPR